MDIEVIRRCLKRLKFSSHALDEMLHEEFGVIHPREVRQALQAGEIIEEETLIVITVYEPDPKRWIDLRQRREP